MIQLPDTRLILDLDDLKDTMAEAQEMLSKVRPLKRLMDLLLKGAQEATTEGKASASKSWQLHFLQSPVEFYTDTPGGPLTGVRLEQNELIDGRAQGTGKISELKCGMALRSIGYRSVPVPGVPFDERAGVVPNEAGRVLDQTTPIPGLYVAGWLKRGPTGVIASTLWDAQETADTLLADLSESPTRKSDANALPTLLQSRGLRYVTYEDWQKLDQLEMERGASRGKPREKLTQIDEMLYALDTFGA
jgi:adrenodoxin-NADP+ reductase